MVHLYPWLLVTIILLTIPCFNSYYRHSYGCREVRCSLLRVAVDDASASQNPSESDVQASNGEIKPRRRRLKTTADMRWQVRPIGVVRSPYAEKFQTPRQATIYSQIRSNGTESGQELSEAYILIYPEFKECIADLEGFDYIWIIAQMHLNAGFKKRIRPQPVAGAENQPPPSVGLFSSRAPHRPNPIALSALRLVSVDLNGDGFSARPPFDQSHIDDRVTDEELFRHEKPGILYVKGLDLLNDTPVLDIKPYIPAFDSFPRARAGWMDLIRSDASVAQKTGYQTIHSARGARKQRAELRKKSLE